MSSADPTHALRREVTQHPAVEPTSKRAVRVSRAHPGRIGPDSLPGLTAEDSRELNHDTADSSWVPRAGRPWSEQTLTHQKFMTEVWLSVPVQKFDRTACHYRVGCDTNEEPSDSDMGTCARH